MATTRTRLTQAWTILSAVVVAILIWLAVDSLLDPDDGQGASPSDEPPPAAAGVIPVPATSLTLDDSEAPLTVGCRTVEGGSGYELVVTSGAAFETDYLVSVLVAAPEGQSMRITIPVDDLLPDQERRVAVPMDSTVAAGGAGRCTVVAVQGDRRMVLVNS